ncbi:DNA repair exonuclease [Rhizobium sp. CSW-27]|uniref:metallophosphoesterase family protein n=1 Tax=Rhizobium sp. CSW-27 TaxID=2839985 RepID=UPI001C029871|nr:DNA repair exonuclease [Rhizobium sp. CSW-27]MBT9371821.1 DNA repair exonuclease [Rhizobium sp. CSW-27]
MAFRFVHTADLHLDSPLRSLSLRNPELAALVGDATRQALVRIVDLCLEEQVDALMIAGDLYDGDQTSMKTARFLATQMQRLHAAGIAVFKIRGNHDALSKITQELVLPPSVKVFGGRAEAVELKRGGLAIAIHGISFSRPQAPESLLPKYKPPIGGAVNIGLMHTSLAGAPGHDPYAPCSAADLHAHGFHYWGLGHIHQRTHHAGERMVIMPGMPQGRDINEAGEKTVSLVTIADDGTVSVEERLTSLAQFARVTVDVSTATDWRGLMDLIGEALETERTRTRSDHLVARLRLTGESALAFRLRRDLDLLIAEAEQRAERAGRTWVEKLELAVAAPSLPGRTVSGDPVLELGTLMRDEVLPAHSFRQEVRDLVQGLLDDLPPEARRLAGNDPAAFDVFVETVIREGSEDLVARLVAASGEER